MTPAGILGGRFYFAKNLTVSVFWKSFGGGGSRTPVRVRKSGTSTSLVMRGDCREKVAA